MSRPGNGHWREWITGKAVPLLFWAPFLAAKGAVFARESGRLAREGLDRETLLLLVHDGLTVAFFLLVMAAYWTRSQAVGSARGFRERVFPMLVFFAGVAGVFALQIMNMPPRFDLAWEGVPIAIGGLAMSVWSLWHLRSAFSIMAEARHAVTNGPYSLVRHPLYLGEGLTMLGLCLKIGTLTALLFWASFTALQLMRARFEEEKLSMQFDEYRAYRARTRFIIPGLY